MNFFDAMKELEKGKKVRNKKWCESVYISLERHQSGDTIIFHDTMSLYLDSRDINQGSWEIYKESILDEKEKEYLNNIIKPFKHRVLYISKQHASLAPREEFIQIGIKCLNGSKVLHEVINLPTFVESTMYKHMKPYYEYTMEELELDE